MNSRGVHTLERFSAPVVFLGPACWTVLCTGGCLEASPESTCQIDSRAACSKIRHMNKNAFCLVNTSGEPLFPTNVLDQRTDGFPLYIIYEKGPVLLTAFETGSHYAIHKGLELKSSACLCLLSIRIKTVCAYTHSFYS